MDLLAYFLIILFTLASHTKLSEKLKSILLSHGIRIVFKPLRKLGRLLSSFKNAIESGYRQGVFTKQIAVNATGVILAKLKAGLKRAKRSM